MKLKLRKRRLTPMFLTFLLFFLSVLPVPFGINKAMAATNWQPIGNSTVGLNVDVTQETSNPSLVQFNNEVYAAWSESSDSTQNTIHIKKYNGSKWDYVGGGVGFLADASATARGPVMTVYNNELYITWYELSNKGNQIRVKKYDGSNWAFVDGGGSTGLNMNPPAVAYIPHLVVYKNELYIIWVEDTNGHYQIRVKKFNGSIWTSADGGGDDGLNANPSLHAGSPASVVYNGNLYISWNESDWPKSRVRVKKYDGSTWSFVDGPNGLNNDDSSYAENGSLKVFNNALYAAYSEDNGSGKKLRVKKFDGSSWASADGGSSVGINVDASKNARYPHFDVYNNALYLIWSETNGTNLGGEIRVKKYDGINWGEASHGIFTLNTSRPSAIHPQVSATRDSLFAAWIEFNGYQNQVRVMKYDGATWLLAYEEINVGLNGNLIDAYDPDLKEYKDELYAAWVEAGKIKVNKYSNGFVLPVSGSQGLNVDPTKEAKSPKLAMFRNQLYASWIERDNANVWVLRIKKFDGYTWIDDDDCCRNGLNADPGNEALSPSLLTTDDGMYAVWAEAARVGFDIQVKKFDGTWKSLGRAASHTTGDPSLAMFHNELYGSWLELNGNQYQTRIKKFNGQEWVYADNGEVGGTDDISSSLIVFNNELYVVWSGNSSSGTLLKVKRFDGTRWESVENIADSSGVKSLSALKVYGDTLFATWTEQDGWAERVRVKQFNGTSWYAADDGGANGLNVDASRRAVAPVMEVHNGDLYVSWSEYNGVSNQIRMARYTGAIIPPEPPVPPVNPVIPAPPTGLVATPGDGQAFLQWNSVTGATYYQVYQGTSPGSYGSSSAVTVSGATYSTLITGLSNASTYYFAVQAGNADGVSPLSAEVSVIPQAGHKTELHTLALSQGTLTPAFDFRTLAYTAEVPNIVSSLTVTASVYDPLSTLKVNGAAVLSGQKSSPINLAAGSNIISAEVTAADGATKIYTINVTREAASSSSGGNSSGSDNSPSTPSGGQTTNDQNASGTVTFENGQKVINVSVDAAKLVEQLEKGGDKPTFVIPVNQDADKVSVALNGDALKAMDNFKQAVIAIETPNGSYKLPAAQIDFAALSAQFGQQVKPSDLSIRVDIAKSDATKVNFIGSAADKGQFTVMVAPVDFTVSATYKDKTVSMDQFSKFVEREIPIPSGIDPNKITTAVVLNDDGSIRQVPTRFITRGGISYAVVKSLTNSTYVLIAHQKTFADTEEHWAKDIIHDMASRLVVNGVEDAHFAPNAPITRAEFAAIIVRALGLDNKGKSLVFKDVDTTDWFNSAVAKALEYGLIDGYEDGSFQPEKTVTREEAMVMMVRAMKLANLEPNVNDADIKSVLATFADGASVDAWARQGVSAAVKSKLINGTDTGLLPKRDITRAESTVLIHRMLEKTELIDGVRTK
ncbi:S-layer homology domain-containing protein [Paenibacillus chitinolyticus]|uniref:S-layer homology domain-containing protein n=1 Tax=Paenibacillus chitinolyticus TaxID=79263 RepID=UPI0035D9DD03